jgi:hypothetical protein
MSGCRGGSFKEIELSLPIAKLSWLRFGLASAGYRGLGVQDRRVYTAGLLTADSIEHDEIPGVRPPIA